MASKKYAYYNKGNKIAVIEQSDTTSTGRLAVAHCTISGNDNQTDCEAAGGQWIPGSSGNVDSYGEYKSPVDSVASGLEIEYSYAPIYRTFQAENDIDTTYYLNGWFVLDGYLCFVRGSSATYGVSNWSSNIVVSGSKGDTGGQSLDYFLITGSSRWNGLHRVQTAGGAGSTLGGGILKTYTRADSIGKYSYGIDLDVAADGTIFDGGGSPSQEVATNGYNVGDYVFVSGFDAAANNGVFRVKTVSVSGTSTNDKLTFDNRYYMESGNTETPETELSTAETLSAEAAADNNITIAQLHHEVSKMTTQVSVLNDESFELDITRKQAHALMYYIKARLSEDMADLKMREYFMRLFNKTLEESSSSRNHGPRFIQGFSAMRK